MRAPRYEDYVTYDPEPEVEPEDERYDPQSGRPIAEIAAWKRREYMILKGFAE